MILVLVHGTSHTRRGDPQGGDVGHLSESSIKLTVNGEVKQDAELNELVWDVPEVSLIKPATIPQDQAPSRTSPSIITFG